MPDLAENFMGLAASLLKEKHHGVLISAIQLCTELCKASKDALEYLRKVMASFLPQCPNITNISIEVQQSMQKIKTGIRSFKHFLMTIK